ncbi:MAG: WYL domain-containing protein [Lachnospiraceae bacterium]|nr:WYL domain-containing protein [Lachnospiraceae bacterium]
MTKNGKCIWIIDTLLQAGELSLRELNDRWERSSLYDGKSLHERTFARYKEHIAAEYNIDIGYSPSANKYFIENREEVRTNALYRYLLSAYRIAGLNTQALHHKDKLMLEPVPTGTEHLSTLLQAIDEGRTVLFDYTSYYEDAPQKWELIPCFLRIFEGRWYLIAEYMDRSRAKTFALERISGLSIGERRLAPSPEITPDEYYQGCFGIIHEERRPRMIRLRADRQQRCYLRAQPLHESQSEVETTAEYSVFEYYLRPSFDFYQKVLWMREKVELLAPEDVREELAAIVGQMARMYDK